MRMLLALLLVAPAAWAEPPALWHALPEAPFAAERHPVTLERTLPGVSAWRVRFPTALRTAEPRNNVVHGIYFTAPRPTDRAVVFLPWFKDRGTGNVELVCQAFAGAGFNVLFIAMGYQFERAPAGMGSGDNIARHSGEHLTEWIRQAVLDTRRAHQWLVRAGNHPERIGLVGISLGGFVTGTTYGVAPEFKAAGVILAGGNLGRYLELAGALGIAPITEALERMAVRPDQVEALLRPYDPVTHAQPARKEGLILVAGLLDPVVPFPMVAELWKAYDQPRLVTLPTGHATSVALAPVVLGSVVAHLDRRFPQER